MVLIKPHHLLDIFKLYGAGLSHFVPDPLYGHDFFRIGNIILENPDAKVKFTAKSDNICGPCKFNIDGKCTDVVSSILSEYSSKDNWNKTIDNRLMKILLIKEGTEMTAIECCTLALEKLSKNNIKEVWKERPKTETVRRTTLLLKGLKKYCKLH